MVVTKLYLPFDSSVNDATGRHSINNGGVTIDTSIKAVGAGSGNFIASEGDYLWAADSEDWNFADLDFMFSGYLYIETLLAYETSNYYHYHTIFSQFEDGNNRWVVFMENNNIDLTGYKLGLFLIDSGNIICRRMGLFTPSAQTWYKFKVLKAGQNILIYKDDVLLTLGGIDFGDNTFPDLSAPLWIGHQNIYNPPFTHAFNGHLDELKIESYYSQGLYQADGGIWKKVDPLKTNDGGTWKTITSLKQVDGGVWKNII